MVVLVGMVGSTSNLGITYKLMTLPSISIMNCSEADIFKILQHEKIYGIQISTSNTLLTNGDIKRYKVNSIVVIAEVLELHPKTKKRAFLCMHKGKLNIYTLETLYTKIQSGVTLANGKLGIHKETLYIAPIRGSYPTIRWGEIHDCLHGQRGSGGAGKDKRAKEAGKITEFSRADAARHGKPEQRNNWGRHDKSQILQRLIALGYNPLVKPEEFLRSIQKAKENNPFGDSVDSHELDEYINMSCITFDSGLGGVAVEADGNIVSVFKHPDSQLKGYMRHAMTAAVLHGGKKLDCYSIRGALPTMYCRYGFIPVCKIKFNKEFAPSNWNYERDGEPDIVFMVHCGDTIEEMDKKVENGSYQPFQSYDIPYIEDSETECAYDIAARYRDNYLSNIDKPLKQKGPGALDIIESLHSKLFKR